MHKQTPLPKLIGAGTLQELTGLTNERHHQLASGEFIPPSSNGYWNLKETIRALFDYYRGKKEGASGQLKDEQLRKTREEADKIAMDNEERRNVLVEMNSLFKLLEPEFISIR